ncbi:MAG: response regulator [Ilumatobacteraceae bacterium]
MNDKRTVFLRPNPPEQSDPSPAGPSVLFASDVQPPVGCLELILRMAGAATIHNITNFTSITARCLELRPDLIVIDTSPGPGQDVLTSLREISRDQGFLPTVVLTSDRTAHTRDRALAAGATDVITKPCDEVDLVERISNLLIMRALYRHVQHRNLVPQSGYDTSA